MSSLFLLKKVGGNLDLSVVREILNPYLDEKGLYLYDVCFTSEFGMKVLQVLVGKKGGINSDELAECNMYLSEKLDAYDQDMPEYMLEVSSPGAECELRSKEEITEHVGEYVNVNSNDTIYEGQLLSFDDDVLVVRVNLKGRFKNFSIPYETVKKIRLAVKF